MPDTTPKVIQAPHASTTAGLLVGTPIGVVAVWIVGILLSPSQRVIPPEVATALGSVAGAVFGELYMVYSRLRDKYLLEE